MILKCGFISNSSTSSFILFGVRLNGEFENYDDLFDVADKLKLTSAQGLAVFPRDALFIGLGPEQCEENEEYTHFQKRIIDQINLIPILNGKYTVNDVNFYADYYDDLGL